ncbi:MAG: hypothetical protein ACR2PK_14630, partial [Acidimicrobiales bacterium]
LNTDAHLWPSDEGRIVAAIDGALSRGVREMCAITSLRDDSTAGVFEGIDDAAPGEVSPTERPIEAVVRRWTLSLSRVLGWRTRAPGVAGKIGALVS